MWRRIALFGPRLWKCGSIEVGSEARPILSSCAEAGAENARGSSPARPMRQRRFIPSSCAGGVLRVSSDRIEHTLVSLRKRRFASRGTEASPEPGRSCDWRGGLTKPGRGYSGPLAPGAWMPAQRLQSRQPGGLEGKWFEGKCMHLDGVLEILSALVAFDTTSRNSNLAIIEWIEGHLDRLGFASQRIYDATGRKANLFATIGPAETPGYILSGHTDVVPIDGEEWSSDPFSLRVADGRAYARGACDMKGFLAVCLAAAQEIQAGELKRPIHLALSYDEEVGCVGARGIAEMLARRPVKPLGCFVGEPTQMGVVIGHKGKRSVRARVRGFT